MNEQEKFLGWLEYTADDVSADRETPDLDPYRQMITETVEGARLLSDVSAGRNASHLRIFLDTVAGHPLGASKDEAAAIVRGFFVDVYWRRIQREKWPDSQGALEQALRNKVRERYFPPWRPAFDYVEAARLVEAAIQSLDQESRGIICRFYFSRFATGQEASSEEAAPSVEDVSVVLGRLVGTPEFAALFARFGLAAAA
jgi:hypothetical protein